MKKLFYLLIVILLFSCESKKDRCIKTAMKDGYDYDSACEICNDSYNEKMSRD